jgi:plastocyanin
VLALGLVGCGGEEEKKAAPAAGGEPSAGAAEPSAEVMIIDFKYMAPVVKVAAGGTVKWTNVDDAPHTASASEGAKPAFDTGGLKKGQSKSVKVAKPGKYAYICEFHPFMKGTVEVVK